MRDDFLHASPPPALQARARPHHSRHLRVFTPSVSHPELLHAPPLPVLRGVCDQVARGTRAGFRERKPRLLRPQTLLRFLPQSLVVRHPRLLRQQSGSEALLPKICLILILTQRRTITSRIPELENLETLS